MSLYVPITNEGMERLREIARQERRRPQDQAAVLLESALGVRLSTSQTSNAVEADECERGS
jgi:hypothetical protein